MMTDPIADMLTRIRNAVSVERPQVEMPISREIYQVLYHDVPPKEALFRLMTRDLKDELDEK